eukprot:COSAG06_NODE_245_length_19176_cov_167.625151_7_plen_104_part_00
MLVSNVIYIYMILYIYVGVKCDIENAQDDALSTVSEAGLFNPFYTETDHLIKTGQTYIGKVLRKQIAFSGRRHGHAMRDRGIHGAGANHHGRVRDGSGLVGFD